MASPCSVSIYESPVKTWRNLWQLRAEISMNENTIPYDSKLLLTTKSPHFLAVFAGFYAKYHRLKRDFDNLRQSIRALQKGDP